MQRVQWVRQAAGALLGRAHPCPTALPLTTPAHRQGMRKEEPEADVRHAATVALQNALTFAHNNFSNDSERNYVMQVVCEGTLAGARVLCCRRCCHRCCCW